MSQRALRLLTYASGFCFLGTWTCVIFGVVIEQLTNSGVLHDQNLWALSHPSYWVWFAVWTVEGAAGITLSCAWSALRCRTTSPQNPTG